MQLRYWLRLAQLPESTYVFPTRSGRNHLNRATLQKLAQNVQTWAQCRMGFRSSFKDWAISESGSSWETSEAALAHRLGNATAASIRHAHPYLISGVCSCSSGLIILRLPSTSPQTFQQDTAPAPGGGVFVLVPRHFA